MVNFLDPTAFIDPIDVIEIVHTGGSKRESQDGWQIRRARLVEMLGDYNPPRPTDINALLKIFAEAWAFSQPEQALTKRQQQAIDARFHAIAAGANSATKIHQYVAAALGITRASALQLLQRADARHDTDALIDTIREKIQQNGSSIAYLSYKSEDRERAIWRATADLRRECPGAGYEWCVSTSGGLIPGRFEMCPSCSKHFGSRADWPEWLRVRLSDIRADLRQRAIEVLEWTEIDAALKL